MGKLPPETAKPVPLAVTLFSVSIPAPDDVTVIDFEIGVFSGTMPKDTLVGFTAIAGEDDAASESVKVKGADTQPYRAVMVTV